MINSFCRGPVQGNYRGTKRTRKTGIENTPLPRDVGVGLCHSALCFVSPNVIIMK